MLRATEKGWGPKPNAGTKRVNQDTLYTEKGGTQENVSDPFTPGLLHFHGSDRLLGLGSRNSG